MSCCKDKKFVINLVESREDFNFNYHLLEIFPEWTFGQANTVRLLTEMSGRCKMFEGTEKECQPFIEKLLESKIKFEYRPK